MTNKPMLSVERDLIERAVQAIINTSQMQLALDELRAILDNPVEVTSDDVLRWMDEHAAEKRQGVAVACMIRSRNLIAQANTAIDGKDHFSAWSEWDPSSLEYGQVVTDHNRNDPVCYEMELLFKEQPAPVAVVMPEVDELAQIIRKVDGSHTLGAGSLAEAILEEVARLNRVKP